MILRLVAIALFDLPQAVILPGLDVVRIGLERAFVPDLRDLVVAELAIGVADQVGDGGCVVTAERLQLLDRRRIVVALVDRGVGSAIATGESILGECGLLDARTGFGFLFLLRRRRGIVVG